VSIAAESVWKWDDKTPVVRESVSIRVFPRTEKGRTIDFDIKLAALVEGLEFCGGWRLDTAVSTFAWRRHRGRKIAFHSDPVEAEPRRAWADYSAEFPGGKGRSGLAILQNADNRAIRTSGESIRS